MADRRATSRQGPARGPGGLRLGRRGRTPGRLGLRGGNRLGPEHPTTVDTLSAQRRPLNDPLNLTSTLLTAAADGPLRFGDLAAATAAPAIARAFAVHLLWHRRLGIDLASPLGEQTMVFDTHGGTR
jgi:hypothetical protein